MTKVFMWFVTYLLIFCLFAGALFYASITLDALIITSAVVCAVTFAYTFCLYDRIASHPGMMLSFFVLLFFATWACSELWLSHALETEIDCRAEKMRVFSGERDVLNERFSQRLLDCAESGDIGAQRCVGKCYLDGRGVERDLSAAVKWYRLAAELGDVHAQFRLGWFYDRGLGVSSDVCEAERWLRMAAERAAQEPLPQIYLGLCYMRGFCGDATTKDFAAATRCFGVAAEMGDSKAKELHAMLGRHERFHRRKWWMVALALAIVALCAVLKWRVAVWE